MRLATKKIIRVFPNPWAAGLDQYGRPCGVCPSDPMESQSEPGRLVGARPDAVFLNDVQKGEIRNRRQKTGYLFLGQSNNETSPHELAGKLAEREPVTLALSGYYRERLIDGSLIPADAETAAIAGVRFVEPKTLFLELSTAAEAKFNAHFEEKGAYATLVSERKDEAKAAAKAPAEPAKTTQPAATASP